MLNKHFKNTTNFVLNDGRERLAELALNYSLATSQNYNLSQRC